MNCTHNSNHSQFHHYLLARGIRLFYVLCSLCVIPPACVCHQIFSTRNVFTLLLCSFAWLYFLPSSFINCDYWRLLSSSWVTSGRKHEWVIFMVSSPSKGFVDQLGGGIHTSSGSSSTDFTFYYRKVFRYLIGWKILDSDTINHDIKLQGTSSIMKLSEENSKQRNFNLNSRKPTKEVSSTFYCLTINVLGNGNVHNLSRFGCGYVRS